MTQPSIVPFGFANDVTDYLLVKKDIYGTAGCPHGSVTIPAGTTTSTIVGLMPFQAGVSFSGLSRYDLYTTDLDTSTNVTLSWGVVYQNETQGLDNINLIQSASTSAQTGGFVAPGGTDWMTFVSTGNGWIAARINATTTTAGAFTFSIPVVYDTSSIFVPYVPSDVGANDLLLQDGTQFLLQDGQSLILQ